MVLATPVMVPGQPTAPQIVAPVITSTGLLVQLMVAMYIINTG